MPKAVETFYAVSDADSPYLILDSKEELHNGPDKRPYKHRAVHVLLECRGRLIIQQKASGTENAGKWSSAASGHVRAGESYRAAAARELHEELGLLVPMSALLWVIKLGPCEETGNEFVEVFRHSLNASDVAELRLDDGEVTAVKMVEPTALLADINSSPGIYSKAFTLILHKLTELGGDHDLWRAA